MPGLPQNTSVMDDELDLDYGDEGRRQFLGFTLGKESKEFTWHARTHQNIETEYDDNFIQYFIISNALLGSGANGKHIIEVETPDIDGKSVKLPIIYLDSNNPQRMLNITLTKESTFRLVEGDGPLTVTGVQVPEMIRTYGLDEMHESSDEEDEAVEEGEEEEGEEGSPEDMKAKKRPLPVTKGPKGKKAKMETSGEDEDMEEDDEEGEEEEEVEEEEDEDAEDEEEESPPKKIMKKKGAKKGGAVGPAGVGAAKIKAAKKAAAAKAASNTSARGKAVKAKK